MPHSIKILLFSRWSLSSGGLYKGRYGKYYSSFYRGLFVGLFYYGLSDWKLDKEFLKLGVDSYELELFWWKRL